MSNGRIEVCKAKYEGQLFKTNEGYTIKVINYINNRTVEIEFIDWDKDMSNKERLMIQAPEYRYTKTVEMQEIRRRTIGNRYRKSVLGVGYIGDGKYRSTINAERTKEYAVWRDMIRRCYAPKVHQKSYLGIKVIQQWHNFQIFANWYTLNNYESTICKHKELDKDISIRGNNTYSSEACLIVPNSINMLFVGHPKKDRKCPIGVNPSGDRYTANITEDGIKYYLGTFDTANQAFHVYKESREIYIKEKANEFWNSLDAQTKLKDMPQRVYKALMEYTVEIDD